jgi:3-deoxy-D-manno-octulosonate 8-phosphate phosphatase (KDO 8-P phosphatase)
LTPVSAAEGKLAATARTIEVVALDVDGVLTDGTFWWGPNGEEWKRFGFADVMGISRGSRAGLSFALISGEGGPLIDRYAAKLGITEVHKACKDKSAALRLVSQRLGAPLGRICFVGDDVNDLPALELAGLSAAPANAQPPVLAAVDMALSRRGGNGAVRELVEFILASR